MMSPNPFDEGSSEDQEFEADEEEPFRSNQTKQYCPMCGHLLFEALVFVYWKHTVTMPGFICSDCCYTEYDIGLMDDYKKQFTMSGGVITEIRKEYKVKK